MTSCSVSDILDSHSNKESNIPQLTIIWTEVPAVPGEHAPTEKVIFRWSDARVRIDPSIPS
jgi:hypothetical protein